MLTNTCIILFGHNRDCAVNNTASNYLTSIAGMPLIIRTILSLQKCGMQRIFFVCEHIDSDIQRDVSDETRINMEIEWIDANKISPVQFLSSKCSSSFLLMKDLLVFDHMSLRELISPLKYGRVKKRVSLLSQAGMAFVSSSDALDLREGDDWLSVSDKIFKDKRLIITEKDHLCKAEHITDRNSVKRAEALVFTSIKSPTYGFMEKMLDRKISILISMLLVKTGITPNQITLFSTFIGILSVILFLPGVKMYAVFGSILFILSTIIDCCDGEVARIKFLETKSGSMLDIICDNIVQIPLFLSIAYGVSITHHSPHILSLGIIAVIGSTISFLLIFSNMLIQERRAGAYTGSTLTPIEKREYNLGKYIDNFINRDFSYIILFCSLYDMLDWFVILTAIGSNTLWIAIIIKKRKRFYYSTNAQKGV